jgi:glutamine cyclotransferase
MIDKMKYLLLFAFVAILAGGCHSGADQEIITLSPNAGTTIKAGKDLAIQAHYPASIKTDSVIYLIDSTRVGSAKDSTVLNLKTDTIALGPRVITAKIYHGAKMDEVSTNIVLLPAKAPDAYTYRLVKTFPHDTSCFTEGLVYEDGFLYESGGGQSNPPPGEDALGQSSLRQVDLNSGKVTKKFMVDPRVFAEGMSIVGDKIIQLTWKERIGYVYDKNTFKLLKTFINNVGVEGWGLCFDGKKLYMDDSTNRIWFLNKDTYQQTGYIDVYDDKGAVTSINELEFIDGKIYANVWQTNNILVIDPKTGAVLQKIDLASLYPEGSRAANADVLNGIAYDAKENRIFVTGKKWPNLYQVVFVKKQ